MGKIKEFLKKEEPWYFAFTRDLVLSLFILGIFLSGIYLYSGVWPPMVAVESGSMEPNIEVGDVVFIKKGEVVTFEEGEETGFNSFNRHGDVIVYDRPNDYGPPIIHRAMYYVEEGEAMWEDGPNAPHSGYITKGDNNNVIDQNSKGIAYHEPIKKEWIKGKAQFKIPIIGKLRLIFNDVGELTSRIHYYPQAIQYRCTPLFLQ